MTTNATHTVRISCDCRTCKVNAAKVGHAFPLAAFIRPEAAAKLNITDANATDRKVTHNTIHMAHDPIIGKVQKMAIAVA